MKPKSTQKLIQFSSPLITLLAMLGSGIFLEQSAVAQSTFTWTGGGADGNWTTANNWGGTAPGSPQVFLNFTNNARLINTNNFAAGSAGFQIYFKSGAGAFTNYGNSISFFDFSTVDPNIQNEGATTQTINFPIVNGNTHGANGILNINLNASPAQGPLVFNGPVSNLDALVAVRAINVSGGSPVRFNGVLADFSSSGKLALTQLGGGTTTLAATNTYTGATTINAGRVTVDAAGLLGSGSYAGAIAITGGALFEYAGTNAQTLSGAITGGGGLIKSGILKSDLTLSSTANTYSGTTTITNGRVVVTAPSNLSSGATAIVQTNAGQIYFNVANLTFSNSINISSIGYPEGDLLANTDGAIRVEGSTLAGTITLSGNSRIGQAFSGLTNTISGQITGAFGLDLYGMNIGGTGNNRELFVLSNPANNFTGGLALYNRDYNASKTNSSTTLRLGASGVIPSGASAGNLSFTGADANHLTILDLFGFNQTINGTTVTAAGGARITNSASSASVLTVGTNNTTSTFNGIITDGGVGSANTLAITKTGTGTFILSGANTYAGNTTLNSGTLEADNSSALGSSLLVMNGGSLSNNVSATLTNAVNLAAGSTVGVGTSQTLTLGGAVTNTGALNFVGPGTLVLSNAGSAFSGGITISNSGTLSLKNVSVFGTGTLTVNTGGAAYNFSATAATITNAVTLSGGQFHTGGGNSGTKNTWSGPVTLAANSTINSDGGTTGNTFTGVLNMGNSGYTLTVNGNGNNAGSDNNFNSVISGGTNALFLVGASGVAHLNAANTFSGTNRSGFSIVLQNANAMQNATLDMNAADNGSVTLISGAVIGALAGSRNLNMGGFTVSIGNNNANTTFTGALTNNGSLTKIGTGTLTLSGTNTYSNTTLISAGKLALSGSGSLGSTNIIVGGGATFDVSGLTAPFTLGSTFTLSNNASGAIINGTNNCSVGTISLRYDGVNPCFIQTNGVMTILSSTVIKILNTGTALAAGTNTIIAAATSGNLGLVTGSVPSVVVAGNGVAAGNSVLLQTNAAGGLDLLVLGPQTWTGASDTSWTTAGNWLSGIVPGSGSAIVFNSASVANLATVLNTNFSIYSVIVTNPSGPVSIGGANALTMAGGINMSSASQNLSIAAPVIMSANQTWSVTNSRTLSVSSNVSGNVALTVAGGGTVTLGASNNYTGGTTINGGTVQAGDNNALGAATTTLTFGAASNGKLQVNSRTVSVGSLSGDATATIENANSLSGALTINNSGAVSFSGVFQDGTGGGALVLNKSGAGTLTLSATNSFSGGTTINGGIITAATNNSLGSGAVAFNGGIRLLLANGVTITNAITLGSNAGASANNLLQVSTGNTATFAGPITINNVAAAGGHLGSTDANGILNVQGSITVNNGVTLVQRAGTVVYSGGGNYTNVQVNQDKVIVGANNGIATSANFNTSIGANAAVTFDLNGFNQTIAGITRAGANAVTVTNSSSTTDSTLTLNGTSTFAGSIVDSGSGAKVSLAVSGGAFTLTGTNRYRGNTIIGGGTLALSGGAIITNSPNIVVANGAMFDVSALTSAFTLAQTLPGQTLSNSAPGAVISGNNNTASGTVSLVYDGVNPSIIITNGTMTLSAATAIKVNSTGAPLTPGTYKIISKAAGGAVAGTVPSSVTVSGGPSAGTPSLAIVGGELYLTVGGSSSISYTATGPFTYNGAAQSPTANFTGSTGAQTSAYVGVSVSYGPSANAPTNAGSYYVSNTVAADANYFGATASQSFTILPASLGVTAINDSKTYNGIGYTGGNGVTYSGFVNSETPAVLGGVLAYGGTSQNATNAGTYSIAPSGQTSSNYAINYTNGTLTINQATSVINTAPTASAITYGQMLSDSTLSGGSATPSGGSFTFTSPSTIPSIGTASYGVTYTPLDTTNYTSASTTVSVTVNSACTSPTIVGGISPGSLTAVVGDQVVLTVTNVTGTSPFSYQWLSNSVAIAIATNSSYTNLSVLVTDAGNYQVVITNDCGSITSSVAVLTVNLQTPLIAALPTAATITYGQALSAATLSGGSVTNAAGATITGSFAYNTPTNVPNAGTLSVSVTFTPADTNNYNNISTSVSVIVNPAATFVGASSTKNPSGYTDSVSYIATLPADATGSVVFSSTNGAFSTNTVSGTNTTSLAITTLPRGTNLITVAYLGDSNYVGSTNSLNQIVTNHPPVASAASYTRNAAVNQIKIAITNLLTNATDVDGDSLTLASVSATTNGITPIISGSWVLYDNTNAVADQFSYTVSDGFGGTNSATVTINIDSTPLFGQSTVVSTSGGTATLNFAGIPTYSYSVNRSTNLTDWITIWTTNAPTSGAFQFIDTSAPTPSAYYQLQFNP